MNSWEIPIKLFVVEDNLGDVLLLKYAMEDIEFRCDFDIVSDGVDALDRIDHLMLDAVPDLFLVDLNLPKASGWECIEALQRQNLLERTCVIVLSTSDAPTDRELAEQFGVGFFKKPVSFDGYVDMVHRIVDYMHSNRHVMPMAPTVQSSFSAT